jgi:hypothetical protein
MNIHSYILAWNESKILPFILDYHSKISSKIFVFDNMSTDSSDEIYKKYDKVTVIKWSSDNEFHDGLNAQIKSNCYKKYSRGQNVDWVIVSDCDELVYHPNLIEKLTEYKLQGIDIPSIDGRNIVSDTFPEYDGTLITDKLQIGSPETYAPMCKNIIFNPEKDVNFGMGAHASFCENCKRGDKTEIKLLHYKFLSKEYVKELYDTRLQRLSQFNKTYKLGEHYAVIQETYDYMDDLIKKNIKII